MAMQNAIEMKKGSNLARLVQNMYKLDDGYREVIRKLEADYGNVNVLMNMQIEHVKTLPKVMLNSYEGLKNFIQDVRECLEILEQHGVKVLPVCRSEFSGLFECGFSSFFMPSVCSRKLRNISNSYSAHCKIAFKHGLALS